MFDAQLAVPRTAAIDSFTAVKGLSKADKQNPQKVGGLFEGLLFRMMLETAREGMEENGDDMFASNEMQQIQQMFNDELANHMGMQGQLGVGDLLQAEMDKKGGATSAAALNGLLK